MTKENAVKHSIKCMCYGKSNDVTYLGGVLVQNLCGLLWSQNKRAPIGI